MSPTPTERRLFDVRPHERFLAAAMSLYFFLVITSFWILKPLKKTLFIGHYADSGFALPGRTFTAAEAELFAKVTNMVVAAGAAVVFALLARRLRRERLSIAFTLFFLVAYGGFALALETPSGGAVWSFYLFGDLFSTLMVAAFFAFLNDSVSSDAAKRLYGIIGFGGVAGGVFGSTAVATLIGALSLKSWLGVTAGLALLIMAVAWAAARELERGERARGDAARVARGRPDPGANEDAAAPNDGEISDLEGFGLVFRSRYLLSIAAIVGAYEIVSTLVDFQFTTAVSELAPGPEARDRAFATVYATTNWLSSFVQLFLTSLVLRRAGVLVALLVLPCSIGLASLGFLARPTLWLGGALSVADNAFSYSIHQSAKETLYVPTTASEKYQAKAFIDMFVQRLAKAIGVGLALAASIGLGGAEHVHWLSLFVLPALVAWGLAARHAGRHFALLEARNEGGRDARD
ncbi:MAG: Npt1/Npt2 family nucleotide transporter [Myxococcota bacterium]